MTPRIRTGIAAVTVLAAAGLLSLSNVTTAQNANAIQKDVLDIAAEIKKGNKAKAKQMAAAAAKKIGDTDDLMQMYRVRSKGGLGWGSMAPANKALDGIEVKLRDIEKNGPGPKDAAIIEEMKDKIAALSAITQHMPQAAGKKAQAWAGIMGGFNRAVAGLGQAKGAVNIQKAAGAVNAACNACHSVFK